MVSPLTLVYAIVSASYTGLHVRQFAGHSTWLDVEVHESMIPSQLDISEYDPCGLEPGHDTTHFDSIGRRSPQYQPK